ncbi:MAG: DUF1592 domain-containing protein [Myxococcota bacterium]
MSDLCPQPLSVSLALLLGLGCTGEFSDPLLGPSGGGGPGPQPGITEPGSENLRAPLRRLTRAEFNNTVRDLFGDETSPGDALPADELGNGFGNDADALSVSILLVEQYATVAEGIAERASTPAKLAEWSDCALSVAADTEEECARSILAALLPRAFRRAVDPIEIDELIALRTALRPDSTFEESMAGVIEAIVQSPDFLYRPEFGVPSGEARRPTGDEMATRLSYFLWATMPDEALSAAAAAGELDTPAGVRAQAERMLVDPRSRPVIRKFFDAFLRIGGVAQAERSSEEFPDYTPEIGALMREETHQLIEHVIFDGAGDWPTLLTSSFTFVNEPLASFYGIDGITGTEFQRVDFNDQRRGVLLQGAFLTASTHSNTTSPVKRGGFIARELLCQTIPFPEGDIAEEVTPPDPYMGDTARDRYSQHSSDPVCAGCHQYMDPAGFALENFDAVGRWRDTENDVTIDARGSVPTTDIEVNGPVELVQAIAQTREVNDCFAHHFMNYAYGRSLSDSEDAVLAAAIEEAFAESGFSIRELILALTQTQNFLALPAELE